jgi:hypothetical protein
VDLTDREIRTERLLRLGWSATATRSSSPPSGARPSLAPERPDANLPYLVTIHHPSGAVAQLAKAPVSKTGDSRFESWLPRLI